jgi:branched-chain amino acid transport system permease protein
MILLLQRTRDGVGLARLLPGESVRTVVAAVALPRRARPRGTVPLLTVERARKEFGGLVAVDDLSFEIRPGEILGLIGPNGAGKSTMFNLISGALPLSRGTITFNGQQIGGQQPFQIANWVSPHPWHVRLIAGCRFSITLRWAPTCARPGSLVPRCASGARRACRNGGRRCRVGLVRFAACAGSSLPLGRQRIVETPARRCRPTAAA